MMWDKKGITSCRKLLSNTAASRVMQDDERSCENGGKLKAMTARNVEEMRNLRHKLLKTIIYTEKKKRTLKQALKHAPIKTGTTLHGVICSYLDEVITRGLTTFNKEFTSATSHFLPHRTESATLSMTYTSWVIIFLFMIQKMSSVSISQTAVGLFQEPISPPLVS